MKASDNTLAVISDKEMLWGSLLHLSFNMWEDFYQSTLKYDSGYRADLELSETLWNDALKTMHERGMNMVVIDLGNAIKYDSHPEITVRNAWSPARLRKELESIRNLGLEPIPKLNFSACHDAWLGEYSHMVSTDIYYKVCRDLIEEVIFLFDKPRLFHLGMDEEVTEYQKTYRFALARQNNLWWADLYFYVGEVERNGSRAWIWSDYAWHYPDLFFKNMPKSVLQSNWYYGSGFEKDNDKPYIKLYRQLEEFGYDQIPTSGYYNVAHENFISSTVQYCKKVIDPSRLFGFLQTHWMITLEKNREMLLKGIELIGEAKKIYLQ
jgi:hypothetical protein